MKLEVDAPKCTRCGACVALCPGVFGIDARASRVLREPTPEERVFVSAARLVCPTDAIRVAGMDAGTTAERDGLLFDELAVGAERVRWALGEIPWSAVDPKNAPPELRATVREMAFSENATYSATQRFLESFFDDVDFTQWIAVWFYEETKHPHVLVEWLRRVGENVSNDFILKGRVSTPFMKSIVGTLVTNVISEVTAAQAYRHLARKSPEPVLAGIARRVSGDEARHAASFFRFACRALDASESKERERTRGLEVLRAWLGGAQTATHPVAQMIERLDENDGAMDLGFDAVRTRVVRVIGLLLDLPLSRTQDVEGVLMGRLGHGRR